MRTLKTHHIVFLVCAAAAPLTVVSAGVTAAYAASGLAGVPLGYLICGGLVAMFALGFCAMAKEIPNTVYREPIGKRFSGGWKAVFWRSESGGMGVVPAPLGCGAGTFLLNSFLW